MSQHERMQPIIPRNKRKTTSIITIALSILFSVILPITHAGQFSSHIERPSVFAIKTKSRNLNSKASKEIDGESLGEEIRIESRIEQRSGFDFQRSCLDPLQVADNNDDSVLTVDEYATFVKELSVYLDLPELFIDVTDYTTLPLPFNANLNILTCDTCKAIYEDDIALCCMSNNSLNMINIYKQNLDITGVHRFWLYTICTQTIELIKEMTLSAMPSAKPSIAPTLKQCSGFKNRGPCEAATCVWDKKSNTCSEIKLCFEYMKEKPCKSNECYWDKFMETCSRTKKCSAYKKGKACAKAQCTWKSNTCLKRKLCPEYMKKKPCKNNNCYWDNRVETCLSTKPCSAYEKENPCTKAQCDWKLNTCSDRKLCLKYMKKMPCKNNDCYWDKHVETCSSSKPSDAESIITI